ncbi:MAG TPA: PLP-dependent aminotransferase family protein [Vicinamibacterales bacterium]|nr:PLP-dependent aminotransferase family protein [Vicinamibacterales bacterium]
MTTLSAAKDVLRGVATLVAVDTRAATPIYSQIYQSFRARILSAELRAGQLIPSSRELARYLRVSRFPVLNAYAQLIAEGYFEARVGTGTFVARSLPVTVRADTATRATDTPSPLRSISVRTAALPRYAVPYWVNHAGPFQLGQPALDEFPLKIWAALTSRCARRLDCTALRYGNPFGLDDLREVIAAYLRTSRGVRCAAEQVMIVSGSQQALDIATRVLLNPRDRVWIEEPGYWLVRHVLDGAGCRAVPVPVDAEGLDVEQGIDRCRQARAAFVAPSHQYPLGVTMSATRRLQLLDWAHSAGAWIIEDDYDSEYRYDRMPIGSLQGLDADARVIYIGTFSKVLFPALRIGYIVIPVDLVERFAVVRRSIDMCAPYENQRVVADFIRGGHFARHIRRMRGIYADRCRTLIDAIREQLPGCSIAGAEAGLHVALLLSHDAADREIAAAALQRGVLLAPLSPSYAGTTRRSGFVLGFGTSAAAEIAPAVRVVKQCLSAARALEGTRRATTRRGSFDRMKSRFLDG